MSVNLNFNFENQQTQNNFDLLRKRYNLKTSKLCSFIKEVREEWTLIISNDEEPSQNEKSLIKDSYTKSLKDSQTLWEGIATSSDGMQELLNELTANKVTEAQANNTVKAIIEDVSKYRNMLSQFKSYLAKTSKKHFLENQQTTDDITSEPDSDKRNAVPKYVPRDDLAAKCSTLAYDFNPIEVSNFIKLHEAHIMACYSHHYKDFLVSELHHKLDPQWLQELSFVNWKTCSWQELLKEIEKKLNYRFPKLVRRDEWFATAQEKNESFSNFVRKLYKGMEVSKLEKGLSKEELLVQQAISKMIDDEKKARLLRHFYTKESITMEELLAFDERETSIAASSNTFQHQGAIKKNVSMFQKPKQHLNTNARQKASCERCNSDRPAKHTKEMCKAKYCTYCKKFFHLSQDCYKNPQSIHYKGTAKKGTSKQVQEVSNSPEEEDEEVEGNIKSIIDTLKNIGALMSIKKEGKTHHIDSATPRLTLINLKGKGDKIRQKFKCLPDTGATVDILPLTLARKLGMKTKEINTRKYNIIDASGNNIPITAISTLKLEEPETKKKYNINFLIAPSIQEQEAIISWITMRHMGIITSHFPIPCTSRKECCQTQVINYITKNVKQKEGVNNTNEDQLQVTQETTHSTEEDRGSHQPLDPISGDRKNLVCPLKTYQSVPLDDPDYIMKTNKILEKVKNDIIRDFPESWATQLQGPANIPPRKLNIEEKVTPHQCKPPKSVPYHYIKAAKQLLAENIKGGIIREVHEYTPWISKGKFIPKNNGKGLRLIVDYRRLNKNIQTINHPFISTDQIRKNLDPNAKIFWATDFLNGYFQIPLSTEDQLLTTFSTPFGKYCFLVLPQGLNDSMSHFNIVTDDLVKEQKLIAKSVDDLLGQASTPTEAYKQLHGILTQIKKFGFKLNPNKFQLGTSVHFGGLTISTSKQCQTNNSDFFFETVIKPDKNKLDAILCMPEPSSKHDIMSYLGMVRTFSHWVPQLASNTQHLQSLTHKNIPFLWTQECKKEFETVKNILQNHLELSPYDDRLPLHMYVDAAKVGFGYILLQPQKNKPPRIIQCGSTYITPIQSRYSVYQLELQGLVWAVTKCKHYLLGTKCTIFTDHSALAGLEQKDLDKVDCSRELKLLEKLFPFNITVKHVKASENSIADSFSRLPAKQEKINFIDNKTALEAVSEGPGRHRINFNDPSPLLRELIDCASKDPSYTKLLTFIQNKVDKKQIENHLDTRDFTTYYDSLSINAYKEGNIIIYKGNSIVIPDNMKSKLIHLAHEYHTPLQKAINTFQEVWFWPTLKEDFTAFWQKCSQCLKYSKSKLRPHPLRSQDVAYLANIAPMDEIAVDHFFYAGKTFLMLIDRASGYIWTTHCPDLSGATVIKKLTKLFNIIGLPKVIRSDNAPCFRSAFKKALQIMNINHRTSSPYNHESNGIVERSIGIFKSQLFKNNVQNIQTLGKVMLNYNMTTSTHPTQLTPFFRFFGRNPNLPVPCINKQTNNVQQSIILKCRQLLQHQYMKKYKRFSNEDFQVGDKVVIQCPKTKIWDQKGTIISSVTSDDLQDRSFNVKLEKGGVVWRNCRFIKLDWPALTQQMDSISNTALLPASSVEQPSPLTNQ